MLGPGPCPTWGPCRAEFDKLPRLTAEPCMSASRSEHRTHLKSSSCGPDQKFRSLEGHADNLSHRGTHDGEPPYRASPLEARRPYRGRQDHIRDACASPPAHSRRAGPAFRELRAECELCQYREAFQRMTAADGPCATIRCVQQRPPPD